MGADHQGSGYRVAIAPLAFTENKPTMPERLPKSTCDTHLHIFGDAKIYPAKNPHALYQPPQDCTFAALKELHDAMGIERAVFVQPTIYGTDHSLLHDTLKAAPKGKYRGVAIVDDSVSEAELERLDSVGVRGARFNFGGRFKLAPSLADFRRGLDRVREIGWFVKVFGFDDDFLAVEAELRKITSPAIIDHMGGPDYRRGTTQPAIRLILDLLKNGNWWIGLSNGDLRSHAGYPWDDAVEFGRLLYEAAPDRCMWGTDWPHVHRFIRPDKDGHSDYGVDHEFARVALLERYVPDRRARDRVLVDNPAKFFGFD
jgi:2-pyrone-4,6-dicarboxylate lactonase